MRHMVMRRRLMLWILLALIGACQHSPRQVTISGTTVPCVDGNPPAGLVQPVQLKRGATTVETAQASGPKYSFQFTVPSARYTVVSNGAITLDVDARAGDVRDLRMVSACR
jgi:hypothetical protein